MPIVNSTGLRACVRWDHTEERTGGITREIEAAGLGARKHMMTTRQWLPVVLVLLPSAMVLAGTVPVTTYTATRFTVSMPRSWTVAEDAGSGLVVARQDPARDD